MRRSLFLSAFGVLLLACPQTDNTESVPTPDAGSTDTGSGDETTDAAPPEDEDTDTPADEGPVDPCASCDDGNACTIDDCEAGECTHTWNDQCCFADDECDAGFVCEANSCSADLSACKGALAEAPEGLEVLEWADGEPAGEISQQTWSVTDAQLPLATEPVYEATRFELKHPAKIHAFSVRFGRLPSHPGTPVEVGLHPDFGHNGFDFWQKDPYWSGHYCAGDLNTDGWVTYAIDEPVVIAHPGLVYVAHRRQGEDDAAIFFDASSANEDGSCGNWGDCSSSITLPELHSGTSGGQGFASWNGLSFPFQFDFFIRLHVEYTDDVTAEEHLFQPDESAPGLSNRQSFGDFDNDGDDDLFINGNKVLRNDAGQFVDVTAASGIPEMGISGSGGVWGDYDNDGCLDIFVFVESGHAMESLLRGNCDGTFTNITEASGIQDLQTYNPCGDGNYTNTPSPAAAWWDIDGDGLLDLYVANMICWTDYSFFNDQVWRNNGDNTFSEWTGQNGFAGLEAPARSSRGASPIDYDQDGDVDLLVNRYTLHENALYRNLGDGTVESAAAAVGLAGHKSSQGYYGHSIGTAWGDLDNDGDFDAVVANLAHPRFFGFSDKTQVLLQDSATGTFADTQGFFTVPMGEAGIRYQETHSVPSLGDFDQDGDLDLIITATYSGRPTDFYWGNGDGTFELDNYHAGFVFTNGWGVALSDVDHDGDLDAATSGGLYKNTAAATGNWLQVRAVGNVNSNRSAIGATIRVYVGDTAKIRYVSGGNGQGGQDSATAHVGLGNALSVASIEVDFPGGETVTFAGPFDHGQRVWVYEDGTHTLGWTAD